MKESKSSNESSPTSKTTNLFPIADPLQTTERRVYDVVFGDITTLRNACILLIDRFLLQQVDTTVYDWELDFEAIHEPSLGSDGCLANDTPNIKRLVVYTKKGKVQFSGFNEPEFSFFDQILSISVEDFIKQAADLIDPEEEAENQTKKLIDEAVRIVHKNFNKSKEQARSLVTPVIKEETEDKTKAGIKQHKTVIVNKAVREAANG